MTIFQVVVVVVVVTNWLYNLRWKFISSKKMTAPQIDQKTMFTRGMNTYCPSNRSQNYVYKREKITAPQIDNYIFNDEKHHG